MGHPTVTPVLLYYTPGLQISTRTDTKKKKKNDNNFFFLKVSYDVAKTNIILCVYAVRGKKKYYFPHTVHYCCLAFLKCVDFYKAHRSEK